MASCDPGGPRGDTDEHSGTGERARISDLRQHEHGNVAPPLEPVACVPGLGLREWTGAICRGDEAAFTRFYDLYSLRLYRYLLVLTAGNEADAREVLQTVVVKLASRFEVFDEERRMWSWLCRLARNAHVDLWRSRRRDRRLVPLEAHGPEFAEGPDLEHQWSESLRHALDQLTEEDRELVRAAYVDKRPLQELASTTGRTYKALESRLARLRRKLKTNLLNRLRHEQRS